MKKRYIITACVMCLIIGLILFKSSSRQSEALEARSAKVLQAFSADDFQTLSTFVDPSSGVRFSPYGNINVAEDKVFTANQLKTGMGSSEVFHWGSYDGSGEPIDLTFSEYLKKFVNDADFSKAPEQKKDEMIGQGNTLNTITAAYPSAHFMEYHFPGFDPQYQGMDWKSLRLIFEESQGQWYLVGVIHDQWTI